MNIDDFLDDTDTDMDNIDIDDTDTDNIDDFIDDIDIDEKKFWSFDEPDLDKSQLSKKQRKWAKFRTKKYRRRILLELLDIPTTDKIINNKKLSEKNSKIFLGSVVLCKKTEQIYT